MRICSERQRRPEIVEDFDSEVYGRVPKVTPRVTWEVTSTTNEMKGEIPVVTKQLVGHVDSSSYPQIAVNIQLTLTTPAKASGPVPVMMQFGFVGGFGGGFPRPGGAPGAPGGSGGFRPPGTPGPGGARLAVLVLPALLAAGQIQFRLVPVRDLRARRARASQAPFSGVRVSQAHLEQGRIGSSYW